MTLPGSTKEHILIQALKDHDPATFEIVVRKHTTHLYNACLGLGFQETEADEITQSVWVTFFDVISNFEGRSRIRTFLFGILYNKASEFRKKAGRFDQTINVEEILDSHFDEKGHWNLASAPVSPERFLQSTQTLTIIEKCMELLPLNQKTAFTLKEVDGEDTQEICNILQVSATNLGVLLFRARNQLRECIDRKSRT